MVDNRQDNSRDKNQNGMEATINKSFARAMLLLKIWQEQALQQKQKDRIATAKLALYIQISMDYFFYLRMMFDNGELPWEKVPDIIISALHVIHKNLTEKKKIASLLSIQDWLKECDGNGPRPYMVVSKDGLSVRFSQTDPIEEPNDSPIHPFVTLN